MVIVKAGSKKRGHSGCCKGKDTSLKIAVLTETGNHSHNLERRNRSHSKKCSPSKIVKIIKRKGSSTKKIIIKQLGSKKRSHSKKRCGSKTIIITKKNTGCKNRSNSKKKIVILNTGNTKRCHSEKKVVIVNRPGSHCKSPSKKIVVLTSRDDLNRKRSHSHKKRCTSPKKRCPSVKKRCTSPKKRCPSVKKIIIFKTPEKHCEKKKHTSHKKCSHKKHTSPKKVELVVLGNCNKKHTSPKKCSHKKHHEHQEVLIKFELEEGARLRKSNIKIVERQVKGSRVHRVEIFKP